MKNMKLKKAVKKNLPNFFKPLFWSYNFSDINPKKERKTVIIQTINYGDLEHWKWLVEYYGKNIIKKTLTELPATQIKPRTLPLISLIFNIDKKEFNYAPRSIKAGK